MSDKINGTGIVRYHGAKKHRVWQIGTGMSVLTFCGLRIGQWRPALSSDKPCKKCSKFARRLYS